MCTALIPFFIDTYIFIFIYVIFLTGFCTFFGGFYQKCSIKICLLGIGQLLGLVSNLLQSSHLTVTVYGFQNTRDQTLSLHSCGHKVV